MPSKPDVCIHTSNCKCFVVVVVVVVVVAMTW